MLRFAESEFDPVPFDAEAARVYGWASAAVVAAGRRPHRRIAGLMKPTGPAHRKPGRDRHFIHNIGMPVP